MEAIQVLFCQNRVFIASFVAWFLAQFLKGIFVFARNKRFNFERFVGPGGMPSSHSAFVASLVVSIGNAEGWHQPITALAVIFGLIVMYDAAGVRWAAGKQAAVLNKIVDDIYHDGRVREDRLRELLGHTPVEVLAGALLGITVAALFF
mgnify:CR=1 FL=1